ncbi:rRNA-processing protein fcf2 [Colletotrichum sidae]|uniref:rRNA-processing protein fcf2 n=1 Tax=Colletotrichum sidae TaxID=1347389 RepID=A0A4R8T1T8_9PEZI|nr:rRNA-processing protein fcf2 [Colletotrichum sidae]
MPALPDDRLDELLTKAASRLAGKSLFRPENFSLVGVAPVDAPQGGASRLRKAQSKAENHSHLTLRAPRPTREKGEDTAGPSWFGIPKTDPNDPHMKRDLQLLHMRGTAIDPKRHYKKESLQATVPRYAHFGRIIEGPTEYYSARLTRRERNQSLVDELLSAEKASGKFKSKYEDIQLRKASGKKAFYKRLVNKRRRNHY